MGPARNDILFSQILSTPERFSMDNMEEPQSTYGVLIEFRDTKSCRSFVSRYNGRRFNHFEKEKCLLLYLKRIENANSFTFPLLIDEKTQCPVCLDLIQNCGFHGCEGIMSVLCNHFFHMDCISSWKDAKGCPVCRYTTTPRVTSICSKCKTNKDLWLCMICGNMGCGREVNKHALSHFESTDHPFALQVETGKVWDYTADEFVDRLIESKAEGKLISKGRGLDVDIQLTNSVKLTDLATEYQYLMKAQTKEQRKYYESQIFNLKGTFHKTKSSLEAEINELENYINDASVNFDNSINSYDIQLKETDERNEKLQSMIKQLRKEQIGWTSELRQLEKQEGKEFDEIKTQCAHEISEMKAQLRDLKTHLQTQEKVKESTEISENSEFTIGKKKKPRKKKKKRRY